MLKHLTIRGRLGLLLAVTATSIVLVASFGMYVSDTSESAVNDMFQYRVVPLRQLKTIADMFAVNIVDNAHKANNGNVPWPQALAAVRAARRVIDTTWRQYLPNYESTEEQTLMGRVVPLLAQADTSTAQLERILAAHDVPGLKRYVVEDLYQHIDPISAVINRMANLQLEIAEHQHQVAHERYVALLRLVIIIALLAMVVAVGLCAHTVRHITKSLQVAADAADRVAAGDLEQEIEVMTRDEVGHLLESMRSVVYSERNMTAAAELIARGDLTVDVQPRSDRDTLGKAFASMTSRLANVIGQVRGGAETLASASNQLAATAQDLASGAETQVTGVDATARALTRIGAAIDLSARNTGEAQQLATRGATEAEATARAVREAVVAMQAIGEKISLIDDLATQTNTLALVAGIEAARAGDHGRGFAEVASEVRKLAERARIAAAEIATLASSTASSADSVTRQVEALVPFSRAAAELVGDANNSAREQAKAVDEIDATMATAQRVAGDSAAAIEELAATAEELSSQASALEELVSYFQLDESGARRSVISVGAPRTSAAFHLPSTIGRNVPVSR
ncbi:MAG TPA: methyl-accepting chemotaxis protein [Gemmatimonadaceae bacterium]|nr:methyl-accepting chemotaxis protein [Gemmatimonadaceae bacterium]